MKLFLQKTIKWHDPLDFVQNIPEQEKFWILLHSGIMTEMSGSSSFLAMEPIDNIQSQNFLFLEKKLTSSGNKFDNAWFGYLGYGLKNSLEKLPKDKVNNIDLPDLCMVQYRLILHFDHAGKTIDIWTDGNLLEEKPQIIAHLLKNYPNKKIKKPTVSSLKSNMSKEEYLIKVDTIKESIKRGDLYQANLTRKFYGNFVHNASPAHLFSELCRQSPSPYSAFIKIGDSYILSSSPERFIMIDKYGNANTRPIKGSVVRRNKGRDIKQRNKLKNSEKDRAENLMIVDLMRNDMSRTAKIGSVKVDSLFDINSYSTLHHMSSSISAKKKNNTTTLDMVKSCFPPGSMTGTPKIKAMELCSILEEDARGVYSGAIGWFGGDGSVDLSVVIRTLIIKNKYFEFQVGGAIVADSQAEAEWHETMVKARAIIKTLGISEKILMSI